VRGKESNENNEMLSCGFGQGMVTNDLILMMYVYPYD